MKKRVLAFLSLLVVAPLAVGQSGYTSTQYSWAELKQADSADLAPYKPGDAVLFCFAYKAKAECEVSTSVPSRMDCVSVHTPKVPGQWYNLGDIPGVQAVEGDGVAACHGRPIPKGQWWGVNVSFKGR